MFKSLSKVTLTALLLFMSFLNTVHASLLVSPTRIAFEGRERSQEIVLINTSSEVRTYRLKWNEKIALSTGGYREPSAQEMVSFPSASNMLRFSPKQVTLKPNERQIVRLGLRRPKGLADGEYRSHLKFEALPPKRIAEKGSDMSINLDVLLSYSFPIVVRQGEVAHKVEILSKQLSYDKTTGKTALTVDLARSGQFSTAGNLVAYWSGINNVETVVARLNNVNIYPEVDKTTKNMVWIDNRILPENGTLRIVYEGKYEFNGQIFAERAFDITTEPPTAN